MLYGGFGTLIFFGIGNRTAKNRISTERIVTKTEKTYRTELDVYQTKLRHNYPSGPIPVTTTREISSRPVAWKNNYTCSSQYYDIDENLCGTSQSTGTSAELNTTYYDANRHVCGTSISRETSEGCWETDYYNSDRRHCGSSRSYKNETTYYLLDGRDWDTSTSYGENTTYISSQQIAENKEKAEREKYEQAERKRRQEQEAREIRQREEQAKTQRKQAEEKKASESFKQQQKISVPSGAVREQICLLSNHDINVRSAAYERLLYGNVKYDFINGHSGIPALANRPGFSDQIINETASIINTMMKVMTDMKVITNTRYGIGGTEQQNAELLNSLRLFNTLPFERNEVKVVVLETKIIPFLIKMSNIYAKRDWNDRKKQWDGKFSKEITKVLEKIAQIDIGYRTEIARVENLNRDIPHLKSYYLSQAGFFNAGGNIFDDEDYDSIVTIMRERATKNPTGAAEKTLQHFRLK